MPAVVNSVAGTPCAEDDDTADCNSFDLVKNLLVSGVYEDASVPRVCDSKDILLPVTGDIA